MKETEQHNLDQKTVICEIIEAIDYNELTNFSSWENKTQEIIALQNKWKTIGFDALLTGLAQDRWDLVIW